MGIRAFLRAMRKGFERQEEMAEFIGVKQPALSQWLSGHRYPDPASRRLIRRAFSVPDDQWARMLLADETGEEESMPTTQATGIR